jgi:hypothetical protein
LRARTQAGQAEKARFEQLFPVRLWSVNSEAWWPKFKHRRMPLVYTSDSLDPPLSLTRQQVLRLLEHLPNRPGQFLNRHHLIGVLEWRFDEAAGLWIYVDIKQRRVYDMTEDELADVYGVRPLVTALNRLGTLLECPNEPLRVRQASAIPVAHFTPGREMFRTRTMPLRTTWRAH